MDRYEQQAYIEMREWQKRMQRKPSFTGRVARNVQQRMNNLLPEKFHTTITHAFRHTVRAVLTGAKFVSKQVYADAPLHVRELRVMDSIKVYKNTAAAEGAVTGAGGILLGLADFPLWLTIKMKLLFDIASLYGFDVKDYKERLYILHVFQLAFSACEHRRKIFAIVADWDHYCETLPEFNDYDWRSFQQEYRDYIDLAKLFQLIPGIGAVVGAYVNHSLTNKLGETAINAYRMRWFKMRGF